MTGLYSNENNYEQVNYDKLPFKTFTIKQI